MNKEKKIFLPPRNTKWVIRRKAAIVEAVDKGQISKEFVCAFYSLSEEEFLSWKKLFSRHGVKGLRATKLYKYR